MTDRDAFMRLLSEFPRRLLHDYEISDALHDLVDGATEVLGIAGAGVSLLEGERLVFATAANELITALERVQEDAQAGPCVQAQRSGESVLIPDMAEDHQSWPDLAAAGVAMGVVAVAGIPLRLNGYRLGALNLYDTRRHDWSAEEVEVANVLAAIATGYAANAARLDMVRHTAEQLQTALDTRVIIEQAKGVLAGERRISVDEAFQVLRAHARSNRVTLRSVADAVVNLRLRP